MPQPKEANSLENGAGVAPARARVKPGPKPKRKKQAAPEGSDGPDEALVAAIKENLNLGMSLASAARAAHVPKQTVYNWRDKFPEFADAIDFANAEGEKYFVVRALKGETGAQQATWMLERRYREDYAPAQRIDHTLISSEANDSDPNELQRKVTAWQRAILATDLPSGPHRVGDRGALPAPADASETPPADAPAPQGGRTGRD